MMKRLKHILHSLRLKIIVLVSVIVLILTTFSVIFFLIIFTSYMEKNAFDSLSTLFVQTNKALDDSFTMIGSTMDNFYANQTLQDWINARGSSEYTQSPTSGELVSKVKLDEALKHSLMINGAWQSNLIDTVYFFVDETVFSFYSRGNLSIWQTTKNNFKIFSLMDENASEDLVVYPPTDQSAFYFAKSYFSGEQEESHLKLVLTVAEEDFFSRYEPIIQYPDTLVYILNDDGIIHSARDKSLLGSKVDDEILNLIGIGTLQETVLNDKNYYVTSERNEKSELTFWVAVSKNSLLAMARTTAYQYVTIMLLVFMGFLLLSMAVAFWGTNFIKNITQGIAKVKQGDYSAKLPTYSSTELQEMSGAFNEMTDKINHLVNVVHENEMAAKKADIKFLQSQINPHFLFNTLAAIGTKAKLSQDESVYAMITSLSTLLQASFKADDGGMISISDELGYIRCYLYIQQERFGDRFRYQINIPNEHLLNLPIPRLCIEPIVENAVIHGLEAKHGSGEVSLSLYQHKNSICFEVTDNGVGFSQAINTDNLLTEYENKKDLGIGLVNTHRRLRLIYGDPYGVHIDKSYTEGARVVITIPFDKGANINV